MIRGFLAGLFWGLVVAGLGLGALSLGTALPAAGPDRIATAPPPQPPADQTPVPSPADPAPAAAAPAVAPPAVSPALPAPDRAPAPAAEVAPPGLALPAAPAIPGSDRPVPVESGTLPPEVPPQAAPAPTPPESAGQPEPGPARPAQEAVPVPPGLPAAPLPAGSDPVATGPVILPVAPPLPAPVVPPAPEAPPVGQAAEIPDAVARPEPGFGNAVEGVRTGRLPRIGDTTPAAPSSTGVPDIAVTPDAALRRNARDFANPAGKPPFAVLLRDTGDSTLDLATLAASDLAITLLIDPAAAGAAERAAIWRAGGQEVALLGAALPRGGNAGDFEVALEALAGQVPQALAVVDSPEGGMQGDRMAAVALVPALQARGFGLVTWDRGLNAADQVARREGLPAATIFRDLDSGDESAPVIRRYLDRAAFKAQQDGRVLVLGRLRPETVTAVLEWALDGRASALALAPLSAVLAAE